ncbi:other/SCY1 protein kinase [Flagelloscypha sp. PMI_526]|nr:other/SCY1 protein kinase [Flagelloscypha sp. PMI_526]
MFAAVTSYLARSQVSQNYNIESSSSGFASGSSRSSTPANGTSSTPSTFSPPLNIGPWKVQSATHKVNGKRVSVWTLDKRAPEIERMNPLAKETTINTLKAEASSLSRLRHPSILETRTELVFATESILSSLDLAIPGSGRFASIVQLDEVEIQKGILQLCNGLTFMHSSAQLIHSNLSPESIIINAKGDWKISGLGLTIPLLTDGKPTKWEYPSYDGRIPGHVQRSFDFMAPEYALDEQLVTGSDMYSLGCVLYAVHAKGSPPFKTHNSLATLREHAGRSPTGMDRWDGDLQALLRSLISRHASNRPTPATLPSSPFFSSLPISTLNFLDRATFTYKKDYERGKYCPLLLEEMKDTHLLPYILPNVFAIATSLSPSQFANLVLPSLKPLFAVKEPPQNMMTLLDNLTMLQNKTDKAVFKEQVLPLLYNALESDHAVVQERALKCVPDLCETVDYGEVQGSSLTQKLVPLLSKIRTKEPAVMMATLSVQEAMGFKVDREAVATLVLPQLWAMSMGPLNSKTALPLQETFRTAALTGSVDFESLVGRSNTAPTIKSNETGGSSSANGGPSWDDDVWGSIFNETSQPSSTAASPLPPPMHSSTNSSSAFQSHSLPSSPKSRTTDFQSRPSKLGARASPPTSTSTFQSPSSTASSFQSPPNFSPPPITSPPSYGANPAFQAPVPQFQPPKPNYNISLSPMGGTSSSTNPPSFGFGTPMQPMTASAMQPISLGTPPLAPATSPNPAFGLGMSMGVMTPSKPPTNSNAKNSASNDFSLFDPLG